VWTLLPLQSVFCICISVDTSTQYRVLYFYLCGHFYPLLYSAPTDNTQTLHERSLMAAKQLLTAPGSFKVCDSP